MIFIAMKSKAGQKVGIKEIANGIDSPVHFIAKILQELSKKGFVQSIKGPNGGFYVDKSAMEYSLADIVKTIDGDKIFLGCGLGLKACSAEQPCPIHNEFSKVRAAAFTMLKKAKIGEFSSKLEEELTYLKR